MKLIHKFTEVEMLLLITTITNYIDYLTLTNIDSNKNTDILDLKRLRAKIDC